MKPGVIIALNLAALAASGCKASVNADASASTSGGVHGRASGSSDDLADFDKPLDPKAAGLAGEGDEAQPTAPIGARQDLMFKGPGTVNCPCMSVGIGTSREGAFSWGGAPPNTNPDLQLVIGFSSNACDGAPAEARASYWGYEVQGDDVIVVVENSHEGRPITVGAVIPKPMGEGQVYLRPVDKKTPFARGEGGRCKVGNPGNKRTAASGKNEDTGLRIGGDDIEDGAAGQSAPLETP